MNKTTKRGLLFFVLIVFLALQGWAIFFHPAGSMLSKYPLFAVIPEYINISLQDPLFTSAFIDFLTVQLILFVWLMADLPSGTRLKPKSLVWVFIYVIYPALGLMLYLLWLNRDHRIMQENN